MKLLDYIVILTLSLLLFTAQALAISLDQAKAAGQVGETPSGYLESVSPSPVADTVALIQDINSKRKAEYERIAQKNGTSLMAVEALAGKKAINNTPLGQFVKVGGSWEKK